MILILNKCHYHENDLYHQKGLQKEVREGVQERVREEVQEEVRKEVQNQ